MKIENVPTSTVQTLVQMTVIGGNNVFGNVQQFAAQTVQVGDIDSLKGTLAALGVGHEEFAALEADISADRAEKPEDLGKRTLDWIARNARVVGKGTTKIGSDVATTAITEAIKRYMGL